ALAIQTPAGREPDPTTSIRPRHPPRDGSRWPSRLPLGDLGEEVRVDKFDIDHGADNTDPMVDAGLGHRGTIHHLHRRARLLPFRYRVVGQPPGEHEQPFVLIAGADSRAQLAQSPAACGRTTWPQGDEAARRPEASSPQGLEIDGALDPLDEGGRTEALTLQKNSAHGLES